MTSNPCGIPACVTVASLALGCVFTPPPPLPEELAAQKAEEAARAASVKAGEGYDPDAEEDPRFAPGVEPELGMSFEEMKTYAKAQGDPAGGDFGLEEATEGLDPGQELWARFEMRQGTLECRLLPEVAPRTVANFVGLARGLRPSRDPDTGEWETRPYYDGTEFHRVIEGFMIQGGDPTGTGRGNAGYVIPDEFDPTVRHDDAGMLSMANRGPGTGSAQFFITLGPTPHLDDKHTIFGRCTDETIRLAEGIAATRGPGDRPTEPQVIRTLTIESR
jgi:peptidyl-prolyl cis-trans isomerase A (cyclophilin A)